MLRIPYQDVDRIAKLIPQEKDITLSRAAELVPELKNLCETDDSVKRLMMLAMKVEGLPRNTSTHAAGVVISSLPTMELVPLQRNDEAVTTQFTMNAEDGFSRASDADRDSLLLRIHKAIRGNASGL